MLQLSEVARADVTGFAEVAIDHSKAIAALETVVHKEITDLQRLRNQPPLQ
jgi:hypothetical protein